MTIYIPFSDDCHSTLLLQKKRLRKFSTIFDWIIISPKNVYHIFLNDFSDFLLKDNLLFLKHSTKQFKHANIEVMETKYFALIPHHFNSIDDDFDSIYSKFNERIHKLKSFFSQKHPLVFVFKSLDSRNIPDLQHFPPIEQQEFQSTQKAHHYFSKIKSILIQQYNYSDSQISLQYI
jgi:hypothetical protein